MHIFSSTHFARARMKHSIGNVSALCANSWKFASQRFRGLSSRWRAPNSPTRKQYRLAAREILRNIGLGEADCDKRLRNRAWKLCLARSDANSVLALGCGEGDEIAALRARAPRSRILGLDWVDKCLPGLLDAAKADFIHGDFNDRLGEHKETFDLVFSNHVIEHSFDPDELLRSIRASLIPGGQLVSAIPLDGEAENPIFRQALSLAREPDRIQRSDMFLMLGGHPYKTNASEFAETLLAPVSRRFASHTDHGVPHVTTRSTRTR